MKQYKVIPGPKNISVNKGDISSAFSVFGQIINTESANGWSYHSMETISVTENPGCAMFGSPVTTNYYMLIFEREG